MGPEAPTRPWFVTIGTGYSWSMTPNMQVQVDAAEDEVFTRTQDSPESGETAPKGAERVI